MKRESIVNAGVFALLVGLGVVTRWISKANEMELSNFTATGAATLFAGYFFKQRLVACLVPLTIMIVSNLGLSQYNNFWEPISVFVALMLPVALGWLLQRRLTAWRLVGFAILPGVVFYLVTNCVFWPSYELHPRTLAGQYQSYVAALPFLRNTLAGDLLFSGLLFGAYWLALAAGLMPRRAHEVAVPVARKA